MPNTKEKQEYIERVLGSRGVLIDVKNMEQMIDGLFKLYSYRDLSLVCNYILTEVVKKLDKTDTSRKAVQLSTVSLTEFKAAAAAKPTRNKQRTIEENERFARGEAEDEPSNRNDQQNNKNQMKPKYRKGFVFCVMGFVTISMIAVVLIIELSK